jgi:hypothetical protein
MYCYDQTILFPGYTVDLFVEYIFLSRFKPHVFDCVQQSLVIVFLCAVWHINKQRAKLFYTDCHGE